MGFLLYSGGLDSLTMFCEKSVQGTYTYRNPGKLVRYLQNVYAHIQNQGS